MIVRCRGSGCSCRQEGDTLGLGVIKEKKKEGWAVQSIVLSANNSAPMFLRRGRESCYRFVPLGKAATETTVDIEERLT